MGNVTSACRDINQLSPQAQVACNLFITECKKAGLNVLITETYRPQARQNYLYEQGRTRPGKIVTWTKSSRHTGKMAWDICKNVKGQEYSDNAFFDSCGKIARSLGITWGGTWSTPDKPHFEITSKWKSPIKEDDEMVESSKIIINGKEVAIDRILKDGKNYVDIRDIADALGYKISNKGSIAVLDKTK